MRVSMCGHSPGADRSEPFAAGDWQLTVAVTVILAAALDRIRLCARRKVFRSSVVQGSENVEKTGHDRFNRCSDSCGLTCAKNDRIFSQKDNVLNFLMIVMTPCKSQTHSLDFYLDQPGLSASCRGIMFVDFYRVLGLFPVCLTNNFRGFC